MLQSDRRTKLQKFQNRRYLSRERKRASSLRISVWASEGLVRDMKRGFLFISDCEAANNKHGMKEIMVVNKVLSALGAVMIACMVCYADAPSKDEVANANAVVTDVLAPKIEEMKSGKAKPNEVADYALSLMGEAETPAAKYALAGNAYAYYMKGGEYAKAAEAIGKMREAIPDIPADRLLKALSPAAKGVSASKAPEVYAILADLQGKVQSQGEITKLTAQIKGAKVSERPMLYRKLGESYAVIGDWRQALENLSKGDGEVAKVAQDEMGNTKSVGKLAGMWWDASEEKGVKPAVASAYRQHAAELYKKGLEDGSISGLNKTLAEQRIETGACAAEASSVKSPFKMGVAPGTVCTLTLSDNCNMDFVYCPAGSFKMGYEGAEKIAPLRQIQISRPFWMSKCRVTYRQLLNGGVKVEDSSKAAKVYNPATTIDKFSSALTEKFGHLLPKGYVFRVCTEAEYEYVAKVKAKKGDPRLTWNYTQSGVNSPWGVEDMFSSKTIICFEDTVPYDDGKSWVRVKKGDTGLKVMDYSKQPNKDPVLIGKTSVPLHLRREFNGPKKEKFKLSAHPEGKDMGNMWGSQFYLVAAPSVDMLNKFP